MANIKSAKKRALQSEVRKKQNVVFKSKYRTCIKKVAAAVLAKEKEAASKALAEAVSTLDKIAAKGIIGKNTAARYKSRINQKVKQLVLA